MYHFSQKLLNTILTTSLLTFGSLCTMEKNDNSGTSLPGDVIKIITRELAAICSTPEEAIENIKKFALANKRFCNLYFQEVNTKSFF